MIPLPSFRAKNCSLQSFTKAGHLTTSSAPNPRVSAISDLQHYFWRDDQARHADWSIPQNGSASTLKKSLIIGPHFSLVKPQKDAPSDENSRKPNQSPQQPNACLSAEAPRSHSRLLAVP